MVVKDGRISPYLTFPCVMTGLDRLDPVIFQK
jgi:hypothetical protein